MLQLWIGLAAVAIGVATWVRRRGSMRRYAAAHGWSYTARGGGATTTWTLPPFARLPSPGVAVAAGMRTVTVFDAVRFRVSGSEVASLTLVESLNDQVDQYHVVALRTDQGLPRTMIRAGIDVYVLPAYEGMHRVREPKIWVKGGILSILSEDPDAAETLPVREVRDDLGLDHRMTLVADGDWLYAYRPGKARPWRIEQMLRTLQVFARGVEQPPWPGPDQPSAYVYGAI